MDSSSSSSAAAQPLPDDEAKRGEHEKEMVHRTKVVQFLGRTTPIILQNDNGPCPLLAICNVLSLKNSLNLSPDIPEVSQEKLLSLVAERLIDSNSNIENKDTGYVENQQQNIADAIDLLPRLTTGIDVNLKFRRIDDFEFTRECAIFDLLDIPLYHGWIVDPQYHETADAIGSKSYNFLMGELVSLDTQTLEKNDEKRNQEGDSVDFVAATTETLGVPSPCLSRGQSFNNSPHRSKKGDIEEDSVDFVAATTATLGVPSPCLSRGQSFNNSPHRSKKGDIEEEAELLRVLKLSEAETSYPPVGGGVTDVNFPDIVQIDKSELATHSEALEKNVTGLVKTGTSMSDNISILNNDIVDLKHPEAVSLETDCSISNAYPQNFCTQPTLEESTRHYENVAENTGSGADNENVHSVSFKQDPSSVSDSFRDKSRSEHAQSDFTSTAGSEEPRENQNGFKAGDSSSVLTTTIVMDSSSSILHGGDEPNVFIPSVDGGEPIYEEQLDKDGLDGSDLNSKDRISIRQGELIQKFMKNSASQLTKYGLFCLQDKVKERELCVFFRNNHFNTMFKYEGELYILATDQGYINQPDLVWEKLNEVNGDTVFMTGNFKVFKVDDNSNSTWDEQNAMSTTADYLVGIDSTPREHSSFNSDLQLAMALQQQEFEQPQHDVQQSAVSGSSRMVTGPQVPRSSGKYTTSSSKQESKSKVKCIVM
ncbi:uncharacterized protein LOC142542855 isoform X2 [Primulina tabacum]|uniref:uncharacterized protein LOC142542855 isoform X2 n=1 Tax=Primulina tabacum TaxID=48773 RepID=UPI003F5A036A